MQKVECQLSFKVWRTFARKRKNVAAREIRNLTKAKRASKSTKRRNFERRWKKPG